MSVLTYEMQANIAKASAVRIKAMFAMRLLTATTSVYTSIYLIERMTSDKIGSRILHKALGPELSLLLGQKVLKPLTFELSYIVYLQFMSFPPKKRIVQELFFVCPKLRLAGRNPAWRSKFNSLIIQFYGQAKLLKVSVHANIHSTPLSSKQTLNFIQFSGCMEKLLFS